MTKFQKRVKEDLEESGVYADKVVCKKNGTLEAKKSYFYRMGNTAEKRAAQVKKGLESTGLSVKVDSRDDWMTWPKTSYFVAVVGR